jgi:hypothetical protein
MKLSFAMNLKRCVQSFARIVLVGWLSSGFIHVTAAEIVVGMEPLQGQWKESGAGWRTAGERPPAGWYLRSQRQFDLGSFSLELKKSQADDLVFVYLKDWQICLRPDSITARYAAFESDKSPRRVWGRYWNTATRPFDYRTVEWKSFAVEIADGGIRIACEGKELLRFRSPEEEWGNRVRSSGRFEAFAPYIYPEGLGGCSGSKQILVVHGYGSGLEVRRLTTTGTDAGAAENFYSSEPKPEVIPAEEDLPLFRPKGVLSVDWKLEAAEAARISAQPKVNLWEVAMKDFVDTAPNLSKSDAGKKPNSQEFPEVMEYRPGSAEPGRVPNTLVLRKRLNILPQEARVAFNLAEEGIYTLQLGWGHIGMGWGPNIIQISVDEKPVVLEQYRALMKFYVCSPGMESISMRLAAGPHRVDVRLVTDKFGFHYLMKLLRFPIASLRLVKGEDIPWKSVNVKQPGELTQKVPAIDCNFLHGEWTGPQLNYRMTGLAAGTKYSVELYFADFETDEKGSRLIGVELGGVAVEKSLDIYAEAGWGRMLERKYETTAQPDEKSGGKIELRLNGVKRKALVNGIVLRSADGTVVFKENFGWHPMIEQFIERRENVAGNPRMAGVGISAEPAKWTPQELFDGHNVIANPHFSLEDKNRAGKPAHWNSFYELAAWNPEGNFIALYRPYAGNGDYARDSQIGRGEPGSIRIGHTDENFGLTSNLVVVDPAKRQRFSFFAKGREGAAPVRAALIWIAKNMDAEGPLPGPRLQVLSIARGEPVTPDGEWREVFVEAKPSAEAMFALAVIDAGGNKGESMWVDDAELNGYGAEPLELTCSFAGFHPRGDRTCVVKSFTAQPVKWTVKRSGEEKILAQGELKESRYEWFSKRYYFPLELGVLSQPGEYRVEIAQGTASASEKIRVSAEVYRELTLTMLQALHSRRFTGAVENVRDPQLLDYAAVVKTYPDDRFCTYEPFLSRQRVDFTGGYYDAGDEIQHAEFWPAVVAATLDAVGHADGDKELQARAVAEADWIAAGFYKLAREDGTLYTTSKPQGFSLDNIPLYSFDPVAATPYNVTQVAGAAAMMAHALRQKNPALSRRYVEMAENNYDASKAWKVVEGAGDVGAKEISAAAKALWAEMYLNGLSKKADYAARMSKSAEVLAKGLKNRAYADLSEMFEAASENGAALQDCVWVPVLFAREYPSHPAVPALKEGLRAFADHVAGLSAETVWGQALAMNGVSDKEAPRRYPGGQRQGGYWPMLAYSLAEVGMLLEDEKIIHLAERQLQWCLGRNFADLSMVQGIGSRYIEGGDLLSWQDVYFNHWLKTPGQAMIIPGNVPTAEFRDVGDGKTSAREVERILPVPYIFPAGYGILPRQPCYGTRPGLHPSASEAYLPQIAQFTLAAASVNAALKSLEKK